MAEIIRHCVHARVINLLEARKNSIGTNLVFNKFKLRRRELMSLLKSSNLSYFSVLVYFSVSSELDKYWLEFFLAASHNPPSVAKLMIYRTPVYLLNKTYTALIPYTFFQRKYIHPHLPK